MGKFVTLLKESEAKYEEVPGALGDLAIFSRNLNGLSSTIGCGFKHLKKARFDWELKYDEAIYVVFGDMFIIEDGNKIEAKEGDLYFLREGAKVNYGTDNEVKFFYSVYPINWRDIK
ncbi:cupin domain-containing protein [Bacillus sp. T3]|uniref:cupin domain-containing protein n=1 Tax=Bacillus sp. T3 TaxID=467262 RepID=UPI0029820367|nr:cupin domain-containing protein [Bacillus sp. T3]